MPCHRRHAVLLAEHPSTRLSPRLSRTVLGSHAEGITPGTVLDRPMDWAASHAVHPWVDSDPGRLRERVASAVPRLPARSARPRWEQDRPPGPVAGPAAPSVARPAPLRRTLKRTGSHT
ncbi:hypothetical protein [Streptomyces sp. NBC_00057]|uniref:hypothetical protein n=1 Tax=Streptomyces sp. NBC_00057 TaxID=2975634 RepID=UPI00324E558D